MLTPLLDLLGGSPGLSAALFGVLGLLVGSFLNVVIHRLPVMLQRDWEAQCAELRGEQPPQHERYNLVVPRSACPACGQPIPAAQNIPVISWMMLGGRCANCRAAISPRYPVVEAISGVLAGYVGWRYGPTALAAALLLLVWALLALSFIDLDHQLLPDSVTLPLLWAGLLFNLYGGITDLRSAVVGAAAGYLSLWSVYWLFKLATGKEGMGYGDFKLLGAIGAWLGWQMLPMVVLLSAVVGALGGIAAIVVSRRLAARSGGGETDADSSGIGGVAIPYGVFLAPAGMVALFWGHALVCWYSPAVYQMFFQSTCR